MLAIGRPGRVSCDLVRRMVNLDDSGDGVRSEVVIEDISRK